MLARARLPVKKPSRKTHRCVRLAGDQWSPLHMQSAKNVFFPAPALFLFKAVADSVDRLELLGRPAQLFAQPGNVGIYGAQTFAVRLPAPYPRKDHIAVERRAPVAHQQLQQVKLPPPQIQRLQRSGMMLSGIVQPIKVTAEEMFA